MWLLDRTTGRTVARKVELAKTFWSRFRGLMFKRRFERGEALFFEFGKPARHAVHMLFVKFPIDLVYLDSRFKVVETREGLKPWRFYRPKLPAKYLVELPAGSVRKLNIKKGHALRLRLRNPFNPGGG